jgi:hypothetical protein
MTGNEIIEIFNGLIDDQLDDDTAYNLLNFVKDRVELLRQWEFLKKKNSSNQATNSAIALPTDFLSPIWAFVGTNKTPYQEVPFEQAEAFDSNGYTFYIDYANNNLYFTDPAVSGTVYLYYIKKTDDITSSTTPVWPSKFHRNIAIAMAAIYPAIDQTEPGLSWDRKWEAIDKDFLRGMIDWDESLKKRSQENGYQLADFQAGVKDVWWYPNQ